MHTLKEKKPSSWLFEYSLGEIISLSDAIEVLYRIFKINGFEFSRMCLEDILNRQEEGNNTKYFTEIVPQEQIINETLNQNISTITIIGTYFDSRLAFGYSLDDNIFFFSFNRHYLPDIKKLEKQLNL